MAKLTSAKARKILHDKSVHGQPLTDKQRRFFGAIAGGAKPYSAESGGWLDKYDAPKAQNGIEGTMGGLTDIGFNYNGAWGGPSMQMGGSIPGAVGFTYARVAGAAPANGPYAKKTKASAQNGMEMKYYQEGLDFKPKTISQDGTVIDPMGYWNPENVGEPVIIPSTDITMEGVDQPLIGISDTGDVQYMQPGEDYSFDGEYVTEYPVAQKGTKVPAATTADSARLYNSQMALNKFYENEIKAGRLTKLSSELMFVEPFKDYDQLNSENLNFYRGEINRRARQKSWADDAYKRFFNLSPEQVKKLEYEGLGKTKSSSKYQQYYRDLITPLQNLAAPFALVDKRIAPQRIISYSPPTRPSDYPGGDVMVYDYDPLAIKPYNMRTAQEKIEWEKKYGKPKQSYLEKLGLTTEDLKKVFSSDGKDWTATPGQDGDGYYRYKKDNKTYKIYTSSGGFSRAEIEKPAVKKQEPKKKELQQPKQEVVKKPEPVVEKKTTLTDYFQGTPVYAPTPYHGSGAGAFVGYRTPQGDTVFVKPEDYERMGVPKYGREFIESKKKMKNGGVSVNMADQYPIEKLDQSLNFTNYNKPTKGGWLDKYK